MTKSLPEYILNSGVLVDSGEVTDVEVNTFGDISEETQPHLTNNHDITQQRTIQTDLPIPSNLCTVP
jgi:hypothetical protein